MPPINKLVALTVLANCLSAVWFYFACKYAVLGEETERGFVVIEGGKE